MMRACPHCGFNLNTPLNDGISTCGNCGRVFDTTPFNRALSAGWMVRRKHIDNVEWLISCGYSKTESELAVHYVGELCYDHDEFVKMLEIEKISKIYCE